MAPRRKIPILLLTGFLGSGKTTLLRRWIHEPEFEGAMVVVNELGEIGLDQALLCVGADEPLFLENGCACCETAGDLASTLEQLFFDRLHRKIRPFSRVVVETTGIADPVHLLDMLAQGGVLEERYAIEAVVSVFDSVRGVEQIDRFPEVRRQIEAADVAALTRADLADDADMAKARALVARLNPSATILTAARGDLAAADLMRAVAGARRRPTGPDAGAAHHAPDVATAFAPLPDPVTREALLATLSHARAQAGDALLRVKGLVSLAGEEGRHVVQVASSGDVDVSPAADIPDRTPLGLTIIAQGTGPRGAGAIAASISSALTFRGLAMPH